MAAASQRTGQGPSDSALGHSPSDGPTDQGRQSVYLLPGQLHASAEPCQIKTILGSCVSICLWDKRRSAGGMNHFLLPTSREAEPHSLRFADAATAELLERLRALGCRPPNLRAKIFGGAAIFQTRKRYALSLGAKNVAVALALMKDAGIPVIAQETGGAQGRKIIFNTDDGVAWSRRI
jgi:chemotaxis protein CheD